MTAVSPDALASELSSRVLNAVLWRNHVPKSFEPPGIDSATHGELAELLYGTLARGDSAATADVAALPLWESLKAVQQQAVDDGFLSAYITSLMLFLRSTRCFAQQVPQAVDATAASRTKYGELEAFQGWSGLSERVPDAARTSWRELANIIRFASSLAAVEKATTNPASMPQWIKDRNQHTDHLIELLNTNVVVVQDSSKPISVFDPKALQFGLETDLHRLPLSLLVNVTTLYMMLNCFFPKTTDVMTLSAKAIKLMEAVASLESKSGVPEQHTIGLVQSAVNLVKLDFTSSTSFAGPTVWKETVPEFLTKALLKSNDARAAEEVIGPTEDIAKASFAAVAKLSSYAPHHAASATSEQNGVSRDTAVDIDSGAEKMPPCARGVVTVSDMFGAVEGEMRFNDDGASNTLRDLDRVIKCLRLITKAPINPTPSAVAVDVEQKSISGKLFEDLLYRRRAAAADNSTIVPGRKRPREDAVEDKPETGKESAPKVAPYYVHSQPRAILPMKVRLDGSYRSTALPPPFEDVWKKHCAGE